MSPYPLLKLPQVTVADSNHYTVEKPFSSMPIWCCLMWLDVSIWSTSGPRILPDLLMIKMHTKVGKCRRFYHPRHRKNSGFGNWLNRRKIRHQIMNSWFGDVLEKDSLSRSYSSSCFEWGKSSDSSHMDSAKHVNIHANRKLMPLHFWPQRQCIRNQTPGVI